MLPSGAIGAAIAARAVPIELHAADVDERAARCAQGNLARLGGAQVHQGDLYDALPGGLRGRVDVLVANAPYVPTAAIGLLPPEARLHEPRAALDGGPDGLDFHRRLAAEALLWLAPAGNLLVETSAGQAAGTVDVFARGGLRAHAVRSPDDATVVIGCNAGR